MENIHSSTKTLILIKTAEISFRNSKICREGEGCNSPSCYSNKGLAVYIVTFISQTPKKHGFFITHWQNFFSLKVFENFLLEVKIYIKNQF